MEPNRGPIKAGAQTKMEDRAAAAAGYVQVITEMNDNHISFIVKGNPRVDISRKSVPTKDCGLTAKHL